MKYDTMTKVGFERVSKEITYCMHVTPDRIYESSCVSTWSVGRITIL